MIVSSRLNLSRFKNLISCKSSVILYSMSIRNYKIFITQPIPEGTLDLFKSRNYDLVINKDLPLTRSALLNSISDCDGLFCTLNEKIDKEILDSAKNLKVFCFGHA